MSPILRTLVPRLRAVPLPHQICRQWQVRPMSYEAPPPTPLRSRLYEAPPPTPRELKMIELEAEVKEIRCYTMFFGTCLAVTLAAVCKHPKRR